MFRLVLIVVFLVAPMSEGLAEELTFHADAASSSTEANAAEDSSAAASRDSDIKEPKRDLHKALSSLKEEKTAPQEPSALKMIQGLFLCLSVFFVFIFAWKKFHGINGKPSSGKTLRVIERHPLTPKTSLVLVEYRGKPLLLGVGSETLTVVHSALDKRWNEKKIPPKVDFESIIECETKKAV